MDNSYLVSQTRCPECAKVGKDKSGDNLAVYSDGHSYCYGCGFTVTASGLSRYKAKTLADGGIPFEKVSDTGVWLPSDCDVDYPARALEWVGHYELTRTDLLNNNAMWSEETYRKTGGILYGPEPRLIFPVFYEQGCIAWQGRYFDKDKSIPKWSGRGNLKNSFYFLGKSKTQLVLVEDIISAIKLSKFTMAMPLFGSHVGITRFKRLYSLVGPSKEVVLYLDPDKRKDSLLEARRGNMLGVNTRIVYSERDPKEHTIEELKGILG